MARLEALTHPLRVEQHGRRLVHNLPKDMPPKTRQLVVRFAYGQQKVLDLRYQFRHHVVCEITNALYNEALGVRNAKTAEERMSCLSRCWAW